MKQLFDALGYYKILTAEPSDDIAEIKRKYYERAKFWHPDHNEAANALEMFQKVSVAYDVLKDRPLRRQYDLLSLVYNAKNFPTLGSLKIYKNQAGKDDAALRVLRQRKVLPDIKGSRVAETKDICNFREAMKMVGRTSRANWFKGWWAPDAFWKNFAAIKYNFQAVKAEDNDNLQLLVHNAVAYGQENNIEMAWIYANQAYMLAEKLNYAEAQTQLTHYIQELNFHPQKAIKLPKWQAKELKIRQSIIPLILGALLLCFIGGKISSVYLPDGYFKLLEIDGQLMADDMVDTHLMRVDSNIHDKQYLYYLAKDSIIYHGPDVRYQQMTQGYEGQTVRLFGYTPDKKWFKVILDNGEMGFIQSSLLRKGIGHTVPFGSKVYKQ